MAEPNVQMYIYAIVGGGFSIAPLTLCAAAVRTFVAGAELEQLGLGKVVVCDGERSHLNRWRVGLGFFSLLFFALGIMLAVSSTSQGKWDPGKAALGATWGLLFPATMSGWWLSMLQASALARASIAEVMAAVEATDATNEEHWSLTVAKPVLALEQTMTLLTSGWATGMIGMITVLWAFTVANLAQLFNVPVLDALDRMDGNDPGTNFGLSVRVIIVTAPMPIMMAVDLTKTSSRCDELKDCINQSGIRHGPTCFHNLAWLETRLRQMNNDQGLGFKVGGMVLDKKKLAVIAISLGSGLVTLITYMIALQDTPAVAVGGNATCAPTAAQTSLVATCAQLALGGNGSACLGNVTLASIVGAHRLKTDDATGAGCSVASSMNCGHPPAGGWEHSAGTTAAVAECCSACGLKPGCSNYTWNAVSDKACWLKSSCANRRKDGGASSGAPRSNARSLCSAVRGVNCLGNDLVHNPKYNVPSAAACCALCSAKAGCNAWTWDEHSPPPYSKSCWLKSSCDGAIIDATAVSGGNGGGGPAPPPPPPPPAPPFPPGPPVSKGRQVGVSLGGWLLMESSWMYDEFSAPAEADWVAELRKTSDAFALATMKRHWSGYLPDAALDAAKAAGIDHVRIPVGYWSWDAPVTGFSGASATATATAYEYGFNHEGLATGGLNHLEAMIAKLKTRGMRALVDLHAMPGGSSSCQSYSGLQVSKPYFWTSIVGEPLTAVCGKAGPYTTSRSNKTASWMSVGVSSAATIANWIVSLEKNASMSGAVAAFEVINEPALGFGGMEQQVKKYHTQAVPLVQGIFRRAKLGVNVTVNFIGPNDGGMGAWVASQCKSNLFDCASLEIDYHQYYNWDSPDKSFPAVKRKICKEGEGSHQWKQYTDAGLSVIIGEWSDAIGLNARPTGDLEDPRVVANLTSLYADQVSLWESVPHTIGAYYWAMRMGSGWDPRLPAPQKAGTAWDKSSKSFKDRVWNFGELLRTGIAQPHSSYKVQGVCRCHGCALKSDDYLSTAPPPPAVVIALGKSLVLTTAPTFVAHGWESWQVTQAIAGGALDDPVFIKTFGHLSGQTVRFGGISADWLAYVVNASVSPGCKWSHKPFTAGAQCPFSTGALDKLLRFLKTAGVGLMIDLNELTGRNCTQWGPSNGRYNKPGSPEWCGGVTGNSTVAAAPWDTKPLKLLLEHIERNGVAGIVGFELGNELFAPQHLTPEQSFKDIAKLGALFKEVFDGKNSSTGAVMPRLFATGTNDCTSRNNIDTMAALLKLDQPAGFSFHSYPGNRAGPPSGNKYDLAAYLLNSTWLRTKTLGAQAAPCLAAWNAWPRAAGLHVAVTEAAAISGGGYAVGAPTTASFIHSFFSVAQLGQHALAGVSLLARWGMPDYLHYNSNLQPKTQLDCVSADFFFYTLYQRLIGSGSGVLAVTGDATSDALVYAHCAASATYGSNGTVTIMAANPSAAAITLKLEGGVPAARLEFVLTAKNLSTHTPFLNGDTSSPLRMGSGGALPAMSGRIAHTDEIVLPPRSQGFFVLLAAAHPACK